MRRSGCSMEVENFDEKLEIEMQNLKTNIAAVKLLYASFSSSIETSIDCNTPSSLHSYVLFTSLNITNASAAK